MTDTTLVNGINEWLVDQALSEPDIVGMFEALCNRIHAIGIPLGRARLTWPTLHPLFQAETILWARGKPTEFEQFIHQDTASEAWLRSPMKYMFDNDVDVLRRKLEGPSKLLDFPVLEEVAAQGMTRAQWHDSLTWMKNRHNMADIQGADRDLILELSG